MTREFAATLIDFENVFYYLKNNVFTDYKQEVTGVVVEMIRSLNAYLLLEFSEAVISMDAYADFDRIEENAQSELYLLGVETHNVLGTEKKNAADMKLCIDTLDILYNRPEIRSFIFVAGDRDYIPVIQYLKKRGRVVRVVGFPKSTSGDLVEIVGQENFIPASRFIKAMQPVSVPPIPPKPVTTGAMVLPAASPIVRPGAPPTPAFAGVPPVWRNPDDEIGLDMHKYEPLAIEVAFKHFGGKPEIWMTPYLHKLRGEMSELTEFERKRIVTGLGDKGVFRIEKRKGEPNDFSVIILNKNHPAVQKLHP